MKREIKIMKKRSVKGRISNCSLFSSIIVGVPQYKKCIPGGRAHDCKYRFTSIITVHKSGRVQTYYVDWIKRQSILSILARNPALHQQTLMGKPTTSLPRILTTDRTRSRDSWSDSPGSTRETEFLSEWLRMVHVSTFVYIVIIRIIIMIT